MTGSAIVTGASSGIGRAAAVELVGRGWTVVAVDVDEVGLGRLAESVPGIEVLAADLTDEEACRTVVGSTTDRVGAITGLVNVVGGSRPGTRTPDLALEEWDRWLTLNLTTAFLLTKHVLGTMIAAAGGGAVVNISSGAGLRGMRANPAYCAAKAGLIGFTRALAIDHAADGIRVNCIAPGPILTELMQRNRTAEEIAGIGRVTLLDRPGDPVEVARSIAFLLGDDSSYVTGQVLGVDGGVNTAM